MKPLSMLILAALLAGCQDHTPTGLGRSVPTTLNSQMAPAADARLGIDDAIDRIVPALGDAASTERLASALRGLRRALDAGDVADGSNLARVAQSEVESYARVDRGHAAELDAIRLALAVVIGSD